MGSFGELTFYGTGLQTTPPAALRMLLEYIEPINIIYAISHDSTISYFEAILDEVNGDGSLMRAYDRSAQSATTPITVDAACRLAEPGRTVRMNCLNFAKSERIHDSIETSIPESIRDTFIPDDFTVTVGESELFDSVIRPEDGVLARPMWTLSLTTYGAPRDYKETARLLPEVPQIQSIRDDLLRLRLSDRVDILVTYN